MTMRRRALLATAGLTALAGCSTGPSLPTSCSRPSFSEDRLDFEAREFRTLSRWAAFHEGAILATEAEHIDRFEPHEATAARQYENLELSDDERTFIEETDFEESILVGVVVHTTSQSTDARVTHVVDEGEYVHCYVCIRWRDRTQDLGPQAKLIRVYDSWSPEEVWVTFTDGEVSTRTFTSGPTREDLAHE